MSAASTSQENTFAIQAIMGGAVRYNRWIYSRLQPWLGQRILDVGSGYGHITAHFFERERERIVSLDLEPQYVEALRRRFAGHAVFEAHCMD
ncbi:MAG: class I SAM-dependent methyltransferase, partial [Candidatus Wallbacteria bacterium]|nr:class I SAM-dependent methyltransferase [Candidatus Wallbacteria bacterium]